MANKGNDKTELRSLTRAKEKNVRKAQRFSTSDRVEFLKDDKRAVSFLANLSMGGMLLRSSAGLVLDAEVDFHLFLENNKEAITMRGKVLELPGEGARQSARVAFLPNQHQNEIRLRAHCERTVVAALEKACARPRANLRDINELAGFYAEFGRHDDAVALYQKTVTESPRNLETYENFARLIIKRVDMEGEAAWPAILAIEPTVKAGLKVAESEFLEAVLADITDIRRQMEAQAEEVRDEQEQQRIEARVQQILAARLKEIQAERTRELAALSEKLEEAREQAQHEKERGARAEAAAENERQLVTEERARQEMLATKLQAEDNRLAQHVAWAIEAQKRVLQCEHESALHKVRDELEDERLRIIRENAGLAQMRSAFDEQKRLFEEQTRAAIAQQADWDRTQAAFAEKQRAWNTEVEAVRAHLAGREETCARDLTRLSDERAALQSIYQSQQAELSELNVLVENQRRQADKLQQDRANLGMEVEDHARRMAELAQGEADLTNREARAGERELGLTQREKLLAASEAAGAERSAQVGQRAHELDERATALEHEARVLTQAAESVAQREAKLEQAAASIDARVVDLERQRAELLQVEKTVSDREAVAHAEAETAKRAKEEAARIQSQVEEHARSLGEKEAQLAAACESQQRREKTIADKEGEYLSWQRTLKAEAEDQSARKAALEMVAEQQRVELAEIQAAQTRIEEVERIQSQLDARATLLQERESRLAVERDEVERREKALADKEVEHLAWGNALRAEAQEQAERKTTLDSQQVQLQIELTESNHQSEEVARREQAAREREEVAQTMAEAADRCQAEIESRRQLLDRREHDLNETEKELHAELERIRTLTQKSETERAELELSLLAQKRQREALETDRALLQQQREADQIMENSIREREQAWAESMTELDRRTLELAEMKDQLAITPIAADGDG